ncbi:GGDEF domain-containing protein [Thermovibrio sp.]
MYRLSRREIENIKRLSKELNLNFDELLLLAEEDLTFGCQRGFNPNPVAVNREKLLLFQSSLFLKAFKRRIELKRRNVSLKTLLILDRIEEITGGCFEVKEKPINDREVKALFEALNELVESVNLRINYVVPRKVKYFAYRDPLTDLYNRHYLREVVNRFSGESRNFPIGVIFIDMDNLKEINDNLGHKTGDLYLKRLSEVINASVRHSDFVFRIGGDEFLVLVPKLKEGALEKIVGRIKRNLEIINRSENLNPPLSASVGVSIWKSPEEPFQRALESADFRMYREKTNGKP